MIRVALLTVAALSVAITIPASNAETYFYGGTCQCGDFVPPATSAQVAEISGGYLADGGVGVRYPAYLFPMGPSIVKGAESGVIIAQDGDRITGVSQGARVANEIERQLMALPDDERPQGVSFVRFAPPRGPIAELVTMGQGQQVEDSIYDSVEIVQEYDGVADFPDRPLNLLATANSLAGWAILHPNYNQPITKPGTTTEVTHYASGGSVTTYRIPTDHLPLTEPVRAIAGDKVADELDRRLKPVIDKGYSRNDGPAKPKVTREQAVKKAHDDLSRTVSKLRRALRKAAV